MEFGHFHLEGQQAYFDLISHPRPGLLLYYPGLPSPDWAGLICIRSQPCNAVLDFYRVPASTT